MTLLEVGLAAVCVILLVALDLAQQHVKRLQMANRLLMADLKAAKKGNLDVA